LWSSCNNYEMEEEGRPVKRQRISENMADLNGDQAKETPNGHETPSSTQKQAASVEATDVPSSPEDLPDLPSDHEVRGVERNAYPTTIDPSGPPLSKSKLKKLRRNQAWEAGRDYRKVRRKEKTQARREKKRAVKATESTLDSPDPSAGATKGVSTNGAVTKGKRGKKEHPRAVQLPVTLILDCGFDDLMLPKEIISLGSQVTRAYSDHARARYRAHMVVSSFGGRLKERFETVLASQHEGWKFVRFTDAGFVDAAKDAAEYMKSERGGQLAGALSSASTDGEEGEVIYLTSDSPDTLEVLKPNSTYIIGGLVDKNRHKGICYKTAMDQGVKTAKLPIGEYMRMSSRFVLATNHVVEILLAWLECGDWAKAFEKAVPKRKGGVLRGPENGEKRGDVGEGGLDDDDAEVSGDGSLHEKEGSVADGEQAALAETGEADLGPNEQEGAIPS
jgi:tRNA (guanine9-N1)-methyltransferase